ncbi:5-Hydroxyisourate Hydrolase (HIUase) [Marinobacterium lacunae]|uniref:5-hydroxyisourate hydrolase n=1 Tax=Marinobacterium lacunae TaxID=1232683 RepID=A0A081FTG6_9GAMM|nr:hydroxyisourate hydrolase [Marinobacterium lacunae]KEA61821.1 5-Hydroxyisourate Hydrolase (HIUase) [Marinobacterium lacunae]
MSQITTHVLDTAKGQPAKGIELQLSVWREDGWHLLASGITNADGRVSDLLPVGKVLPAGRYRVRFELEPYLKLEGVPVFYPRADIEFMVGPDGEHYHIPLLLSPYGYSTYRGS